MKVFIDSEKTTYFKHSLEWTIWHKDMRMYIYTFGIQYEKTN